MDDGDETKFLFCNVRTILLLCLTQQHYAMRVEEELRVFNLGLKLLQLHAWPPDSGTV
jgi:hypothetical protein